MNLMKITELREFLEQEIKRNAQGYYQVKPPYTRGNIEVFRIGGRETKIANVVFTEAAITVVAIDADPRSREVQHLKETIEEAIKDLYVRTSDKETINYGKIVVGLEAPYGPGKLPRPITTP